MNKIFKILAPVVFIIMAVISVTGCTYNSLVAADEAVNAKWADVQNQYQRRMDLIPNLVATVKGYAAHEASVLTEVTEARSKAGGMVNLSDEILTDSEAFARYQKVQDELGSSLQRLLAITEAYPELKANDNFLALQDELEGTENRITVARQRYNEAAQDFNTRIRRFPASIIANMAKFEKKQYFQASAEAQTAPVVNFDL